MEARAEELAFEVCDLAATGRDREAAVRAGEREGYLGALAAFYPKKADPEESSDDGFQDPAARWSKRKL